MKKLLSLVLAVLMIASLSTTAFADDTTLSTTESTTNDGTASSAIAVNGRYINNIKEADVVSVTIEWQAAEFTYSKTTTKVWNPADHTYTTSSSTPTWAGYMHISVENHSNVPVNVKVGFTPEDNFTNAKARFASDFDLERGKEGETFTTAASKFVNFQIESGVLAETVTESTKIGTLTFTISKITE